jgi:CheY-like chemotaxis protein
MTITVPMKAATATASTAAPAFTDFRTPHARAIWGRYTAVRRAEYKWRVAGDSRTPHLLIVDDGPDMVRLLETVASATWDVRSASNLNEAVDAAKNDAIDVAVVDFMLPGGGGFSVARLLKELQPDCTVVMFSAAPVGHQAADSPDVDEFVMKGDLRVIRRLLDDLARRIQPDS